MPDEKDNMFGNTKINLGKLGEAVTEFAMKGKREGINFYHTGRLKLDIIHLKHKIDENFKKIGARIYKHHKVEDNEIIKLCEEIDKLELIIKNKEAEIEKIV